MKLRRIPVLAALVLLIVIQTVYAQTDGKDWGLGYPSPGGLPKGNESADYLKRFDACYIGGGDEKTLYLTFDVGYENGYTASILDTLKKCQITAAFFVVGTYPKSNPELVKRMVDEGHMVCNHTMSHPDMTTLDKEAFISELTKTEEAFKSVTGADMSKYYRPPRGRYSEENLKFAKELGYKTVFWSLAYVDWNVGKQPTKEDAFAKLLPRTHPGAVILLHNTSETNALILEELIGKYRDMGYTFKALDSVMK